jgi:4-hydroxy-tetrahydrodipicolinate reductase
MGQRLIALGAADPELAIIAALEAATHPKIGQDAGVIAGVGNLGIPLTSDLPGETQAVIDFSVPAGCEAILRRCLAKKVPIVVATTGLEPHQVQLLKDAAKTIPVLWSPSMSLAVNLTMQLAETAAKALAQHASGADVEIIERHHRFKEDAPSGTALKFGELIAAQMNLTKSQHGREGRIGQRPHDEIGYHAVRIGDNPGEHTIIFGMLGETIELNVKASNRDCYAHGALAAAKFLAGKPAGLYGMRDVLGI